MEQVDPLVFVYAVIIIFALAVGLLVKVDRGKGSKKRS